MSAETAAPVDSQPASYKPRDVNKPDEWQDIPLSPSATLPVEFHGKSYAQLACDEAGRRFLAGRLSGDKFAVKILKVFLHAKVCACEACGKERHYEAELAKSQPIEATPKAQPAPPVVAADSAPALSQTARAAAEEVVGFDVEADDTKPDDTKPAATTNGAATTKTGNDGPAAKPTAKPGTMKFSKRSEAKVDKAEAELEATKRAIEIEAPLSKLFRDAEAEADSAFFEEARKTNDAFSAQAASVRAREDIKSRLVRTLAIDNGWAAAWAAKEVKDAEDHLDHIKREAAAIVERAENAYELRKAVLMPKLKAYAESIPIDQRASKKSVRCPGWAGRLTFVEREASAEVKSTPIAIKAIKDALGSEDNAIAAGLLAVKIEPSESGIAEWIKNNNGRSLSGVQFTPAGDQLTIYRR